MQPLCCICQGPLNPHFALLCHDCAEKHKLNPSDIKSWPEWARFCRRDEQRRRYADKVWEEHEIVFSDLPQNIARAIDNLLYGEPNTDSWYPQD